MNLPYFRLLLKCFDIYSWHVTYDVNKNDYGNDDDGDDDDDDNDNEK